MNEFYDEEERISKIGEQFVLENFPLLFPNLLILKCELNTKIRGKEKAEGADLESWILEAEQKDEGLTKAWEEVFKREEFAADRKTVTGKMGVFDQKIKAPIEVKTCRFEQYIARNDYRADCGVISFAIWNSYNREPPEPPRTRLGSLYRMFYPNNAKHERQPVAYASVLLNQEEKPYACIAFENFPELKKRLIKIGREYELDLTKEGFERIPCWDNLHGWKSPDEWANFIEQKNEYEGRQLWLRKNMWYILMSEVINLATVTLIGDPPEIKGVYNRCSKELQTARWNYLNQRSYKTIPLETEEKVKEQIKRRREIFELVKTFTWDRDITTGNREINLAERRAKRRKQ